MQENKGMAKDMREIRAFIEEMLDRGYEKFIIFPFGDVGMQVKSVLNYAYGIQEELILDNYLWRYNKSVKPLAYMAEIEHKNHAVLLSSNNCEIYKELKDNLLDFFDSEQIAELKSMKVRIWEAERKSRCHTEIGKYSYGPICRNHAFIRSIGSFCSFAQGVEVVQNHEMRFLTTHPMIYAGNNIEGMENDYIEYKDRMWFFDGVQPHKDILKKNRRILIGNDVWLGRNVIITNGSNIGNGVIAGAGAVITKDVPDYAVVVGVPARIIKYRYSVEQIMKLNKIKWWNWEDEKILERYDDFYLPVDDFIKKYMDS